MSNSEKVVEGVIPQIKAPDQANQPIFIRVKDDITPEEAFALSMTIFLCTKGIIPEKYRKFDICHTADAIEKIFDKAWRHLAPDDELVKSLSGSKEPENPEPVVDENGKKHYTMNAGSGEYGATVNGIG